MNVVDNPKKNRENQVFDPIDIVREMIPQDELLAQLAEECTELAHAVLKLRRTYSKSNPTPVKRREALNLVMEEIADVKLCLHACGFEKVTTLIECNRIMGSKEDRWAERLKEVQIEQRPALELIRKFNHDNVLIYADPPYLLNTRGGKQYRHEMTEQDHVQLLDVLKQHEGSVILSGYPSDMYDRELTGWSRITKKASNQNADQLTEVLWCNFEVPGLFQMEGI